MLVIFTSGREPEVAGGVEVERRTLSAYDIFDG